MVLSSKFRGTEILRQRIVLLDKYKKSADFWKYPVTHQDINFQEKEGMLNAARFLSLPHLQILLYLITFALFIIELELYSRQEK